MQNLVTVFHTVGLIVTFTMHMHVTLCHTLLVGIKRHIWNPRPIVSY